MKLSAKSDYPAAGLTKIILTRQSAVKVGAVVAHLVAGRGDIEGCDHKQGKIRIETIVPTGDQ